MNTIARSLLVPILASGGVLTASADVLQLTQATNLDITALNVATVGDLSFQSGRIWIADGTTGGLLRSINTNGDLLETVNPGIIPGLSNGPDAIAAFGSSFLFVFSSFGESVAGEIDALTPAFQIAYPSALQATGAEFGNGNLWIASGTTVGQPSVLQRVDGATGAVLQTLPIPGLTVRIADLAFDPFSGGMYALCEDDMLREINLSTGAIVSSQSLATFLVAHNSIAGGIDFDSSGSKLYVACGTGVGGDTIVVLDRAFSTNVCGEQFGSHPCPCGNFGQNGHGCRNSTPGSNGAFLTTTGEPRVSADTLVLRLSQATLGTNVLFFQGSTLLSTPAAFGDGVRCVGGTVIRLAIRAAPLGIVNFPVAAGDAPISVAGLVPAAVTTRFYQGWYRDSATFCSTSTFNLTNAVSVLWRP